ncbi:MAG: hypothetical protein WD717_04455 [Nitrosarchaeum sp.]
MTNFKFCPVCGTPPQPPNNPTQMYGNTPNPPNNQNNYYNNNYYQNNPMLNSKSEAIAIVLSILIIGVGQMYMGKIGRGVGILIGGIFLAVIGVMTLGVGFIIFIILFIWQIIDAYNLCKKYNNYLSQNGRPPW